MPFPLIAGLCVGFIGLCMIVCIGLDICRNAFDCVEFLCGFWFISVGVAGMATVIWVVLKTL